MSDKKQLDQGLSDAELLRYSRQIMLPDIDIEGQERLRASHVLIVGAGGLGSPAALYLAASGVGQLTIVDHDTVDLSNLQRQIAHQDSTVGKAKVSSMAERLRATNPHITVNAIQEQADNARLTALATRADLVLDCTDNFEVRYAINEVCFAQGVPLVSGAGIGWEGQVSVFDPRRADSPCYRCLYPQANDAALNCAENGVIAPLVGVIGTCQAMEAIKLITLVGEPLVGKVLYFDAKYMEWRSLNLKRRDDCPVCADRPR